MPRASRAPRQLRQGTPQTAGSRGNSRSGEAEKKSVVGHQGLIPFKVVVVLTYVSGCKRNWVARWRGKFAELFSTLSLSKRYNHLDERALLSLRRGEVFIYMRKQAYRVKAGIDAVTGLSLFPHSSKRIDFSNFSLITMISPGRSLRKLPLVVGRWRWAHGGRRTS